MRRLLHRPVPPAGRAARRLATLAALAMLASCAPQESRVSFDAPLQLITTPTGFEMVRIPGGRFSMGSPNGQPDELPVHEVWVDSFYMDRYEVTQELYTRLVPANPSHFKGDKRPVEMISWGDAALFCNIRSRAEGLKPCYNEETAACDFEADGYRLPTEAEWEYACRADIASEYHFGADPARLVEYAWCKDNAGATTHPVGQKKPNPWGLHDMYGNVAEWCNDIYRKDYYGASPYKNPTGPPGAENAVSEKYILRGGAWNSSPAACRSAARVAEDPGFQDACFARDAIGFRCVRRVPKAAGHQP
jgi:formylglycine-generating enzyme required for sulfatase activity